MGVDTSRGWHASRGTAVLYAGGAGGGALRRVGPGKQTCATAQSSVCNWYLDGGCPSVDGAGCRRKSLQRDACTSESRGGAGASLVQMRVHDKNLCIPVQPCVATGPGW